MLADWPPPSPPERKQPEPAARHASEYSV